MRKQLSIFIISLFICVLAFGHSGRTDANGGHTNRKTGEYHTHDSGDESDVSGIVIWGAILVVFVIGVIIKEALNDDK